jgi:hypothetical protein
LNRDWNHAGTFERTVIAERPQGRPSLHSVDVLDLCRQSLEKGNCQLEAAGIAGTRTPSEAASNYQLGWFCRRSVPAV